MAEAFRNTVAQPRALCRTDIIVAIVDTIAGNVPCGKNSVNAKTPGHNLSGRRSGCGSQTRPPSAVLLRRTGAPSAIWKHGVSLQCPRTVQYGVDFWCVCKTAFFIFHLLFSTIFDCGDGRPRRVARVGCLVLGRFCAAIHRRYRKPASGRIVPVSHASGFANEDGFSGNT